MVPYNRANWLVKIYDLTHVIILSEKPYKISYFLVCNNFNRKKLDIYKPGKAPISDVSLTSVPKTDLNELKIEFASAEIDNNYPLFNKKEEIVFERVLDLNTSKYHRIVSGDLKKELKTVHVLNGELYVKSSRLNRFFPVHSVTHNWEMKHIKKR